MTIASADIETDLFFARGNMVYRRGIVEARETDGQLTGRETEEVFVCEASDFIDGGAEQIVRALNRLPKAEAILIDVAQTIRLADENHDPDSRAGFPIELVNRADAIEEWMVNG